MSKCLKFLKKFFLLGEAVHQGPALPYSFLVNVTDSEAFEFDAEQFLQLLT